MLSDYRRSICAKSSERHVRLERTLVRLTKSLKERCAHFDDFIGSRTVRPEQTRPPRLRAVTDMPKDQPEIVKPAGHATKLADCVGYGSFVPRRHKREVDVGWLDQPHR